MLLFEDHHGPAERDLFARVCDGSLTGFVMRDMITPDTIAVYEKAIGESKDTFFTDLNNGNGFSIPSMFGQLHKTQPISGSDRYFADIAPFCRAMNAACGFDVTDRLKEIFDQVIRSYQVAPLPGFLPYSFRVVYPDRGGLNIHKDQDLLPYIHEHVSDGLRRYIVPDTMMSWFFTLRAPESGGELWVADSEYSTYHKRGQYDLEGPDGTLVNPATMKHIKQATPSGSLLVFRGGNYWHQVLPPGTDRGNRITFGGFFARSVSGDKYYYWS